MARNLFDVEGSHDGCFHTECFKRILKGESVDNRCQHSHVVACYAVHSLLFALFSPIDIAASEDNGNLNTQLPNLFYLFRDFGKDVLSIPCPSFPMRASPLSLIRILRYVGLLFNCLS